MPALRPLVLLGTLLAASGCYAPAEEARPLPDFLVLFKGPGTELDAAGQRVVAAAAAVARADRSGSVTVAGYADSPRTPQATQIISRLRAQTVAEALVRDGVAKTRIQLRPKQAIGGDPGLESHRVEIVIGS